MAATHPSEPLVSVLVAVCNVEAYVEPCVRSVMAQTYRHLQIVLVDDGSTDASGSLCDRLAQADPRIDVVHKANEGLWSARNAGRAVARGEYVLFVDGDDYLHREAVETLCRAIEAKPGYDIALMDRRETLRMDEDVSTTGEAPLSELGQADLIEAMFADPDRAFYIFQWNKLYRRHVIDGILNRPYTKAQDFDFNLRVYQRVGKAVRVHRALYYYVQRQGSLCNRADAFPVYYRCMTDIMYDNLTTPPVVAQPYRHLVLHSLYVFMNHQIKSMWNTDRRQAVVAQCQRYDRAMRHDFMRLRQYGWLERLSRVATIRWPRLTRWGRSVLGRRLQLKQ